MSIIMNIPAIVRILIVFVFVLIAIRKKLSLGNAFILGAVLTGVLFGLKPDAMFYSVVGSVVMPKTLSLAVVVTLILVLSSSLELGGHMERLLNNFRGLVSNPRLNLAIFPALIGLLPMPGGAVFSAPMVKELGNRSGLRPDQLSFINYWYRHIWEYWWPLYPGILLSVTLADINLWTIIMVMWPLTLVAVSLGSLSVKGVDLKHAADNGGKNHSAGPFFKELVPILMVILIGLGVGTLLSQIFPGFHIAKETGLIIALVLTLSYVWFRNGMDGETIRKIVMDPHLLKMFYMVIAILVFKGMLEDSQAVGAISREFTDLSVPLVLITVALPFIVGGITGITMAFVGSTFPIIVPLVYSLGEGSFMLAYVILALVSGFAGVLLSPLHLCLLLSNQYFDATFGRVYRHLVLPCVLLFVAGLGYFFALRWMIDRLS
jgi:integral membrane protein (TIGR00529 family)